MHPLRAAVPLALAACAVAASPAAAKAEPAPIAHVAGGGGGAPPTYPGLVNNRLVRTEAALDRATNYADDGDTDKAVSALFTARLQVKLAWRAAKYVIQNAPPPVVGDDLMARVSGGAPAAGTLADQYATAGAVLDLQHSVAQTGIGMIDTAKGTLRDSLSRTIFRAFHQRDAAIAYIHSIDVPPPVGDDLEGPRQRRRRRRNPGRPSCRPSATRSATRSTRSTAATRPSPPRSDPAVKGPPRDAELQNVKSQSITTFWPPVVGDD